MQRKINCKYNDNDVWCTNKNIKRSLFGIGVRCCVEFNDKECNLKEVRTLKGKPPRPTRKCNKN